MLDASEFCPIACTNFVVTPFFFLIARSRNFMILTELNTSPYLFAPFYSKLATIIVDKNNNDR